MKISQTGSGTNLLVFILTLGVFGILNTEMGVIGMLPLIAENFGVTVPQAGWTVTVFALMVAVSGPIAPALFSGINRKIVMILALGVFVAGNIVSMFTESFAVVLLARAIPAFFHPVYVSMAFTVAAASVAKKDAPKAIARVFIGVSAGMVLGVPVASYIASESSYSMSMLFFTVVNVMVLIVTIIYVPSMPVTSRLTYGEQTRVLRRPLLWSAIVIAIFLNGATYGLFSYLSDFMMMVTQLNFSIISIVLFVYGASCIAGSVLAGRLLANNPEKTIKIAPFLLSGVLLVFFWMGQQFWPTVGAVLLFGIFSGLATNSNQYMISNAAPEAPDFANGIFLTSSNLGTALGTWLCGVFIADLGTRYTVIGALVILAAGIMAIFFRAVILPRQNDLISHDTESTRLMV